MAYYEIISVEDKEYKFLVVVTGCTDPVSVLNDLEADLGDISCKILFDLTLVNGMGDNRYIEAEIENGAFVKETFKQVPSVSENISFICKNFFKNNIYVVEKGMIMQQLKYLLLKGEA